MINKWSNYIDEWYDHRDVSGLRRDNSSLQNMYDKVIERINQLEVEVKNIKSEVMLVKHLNNFLNDVSHIIKR